MRAIYQNEVADCGYACVAMVLSHFGRATEIRELQAFRSISSHGLKLMDLYDVAVEFGLAVQAYRFDANDLSNVKRGSILHFGGAHFVVFEKCGRGYVQMIDPASGRRRMSRETFLANVSGYLLECAPTPEMPRVRDRSQTPAALARVRALNPQMMGQIGKVLFVTLGVMCTTLAMPYLSTLVLDDVVAGDNLNLLNVLILTFSCLFVVGALSQYVQAYLVELLHGLVQINMTEGLIAHLLRNPIGYFEKRHVGDLFARIKSQDEISDYITRTMLSLGIDLPLGALAMVLMIVQSPLLAGVALLIFLLYVMVSFALFTRMRDTHALVAEKSAYCDDMLIETIRGAALIKLSQGETRRTAMFMARYREFMAVMIQSSKLTMGRDTILKLVQSADTIAITWISAKLMLDGKISVGVFFSFLTYKSLATDSFARAINTVFEYFMLRVPVTRVGDIVDCESERYTPSSDTRKTVEVKAFERIDVRNVTFSYGVADRPVLNGASIVIRKGDKIVIRGPSGAGKSTLFKLLAAAETQQEGDITLNGIPLANLTVDEVRRHAAHMRQGDLIMHGSIAENISLFAGNTDEARVHALLDEVGLLADVMRLPMRTRTIISDTIANISAGQRQRLLLARALYQQRELLLLDEPTSNLDPVSVQRIVEVLKRLDRTVVVITHDMSFVAAFQQRYRLLDGRLLPDDETLHSSAAVEVAGHA
jgi:ATP-binding cassette subfamily B protein RaxB